MANTRAGQPPVALTSDPPLEVTSLTDEVIRSGALLNDIEGQDAFARSYDPAIEQAWRIHEQKLTEKQRLQFAKYKQPSPEAYLSALQDVCKAREETSRGLKVYNTVKPIFDTIMMFLPCLLNVGKSAGYAIPSDTILGALTCILDYGKRYAAFHDQVVLTLQYMARRFEIVRRIEVTELGKCRSLHRPLFDLYLDILTCCQEVYPLLFHPNTGEPRSTATLGWKALLRSPEDEFLQLRTSFGDHFALFQFERDLLVDARSSVVQRMQIGQLARQSSSLEALEGMQGQLMARNEQMFGELRSAQTSAARQQAAYNSKRETATAILALMDSLPNAEQELAFCDIFDRHLEGTGSWLLLHAGYRDWKACKESRLLRIVGGAGTGKSTLASIVVNDLDWCIAPEAALAYFFSKRNTKASGCDHLVASVLRQLLQQLLGTRTPSEALDLASIRRITAGFQSMQRAVLDLLPFFSEVTIVADGLDECEDQGKIATFLHTLLSRGRGTVKIIAFSRLGHRSLEDALKDVFAVIEINEEVTEDDINAFVDAEITSASVNVGRFTDILDLARNALKAKSKGMFLYVFHMAKYLQRQVKPSKIRSAVTALPEDPGGIWNLAVSRITEDENVETSDLALSVIILVYHAKRPLKIEEALHAAAVYCDMSSLDFEDIYPRTDDIVELCADLVNVSSDDFLGLCHESFFHYLDSRAGSLRDVLVKRGQSIYGRDDPLAEICLTYLKLDGIELDYDALTATNYVIAPDYRFFDYAVQYWPQHVQGRLQINLEHLIDALFEMPQRRILLAWVLFKLRDEPLLDRYFRFDMGAKPPPKLHMLAAYGQLRLIEAMNLTNDALFATAREEDCCNMTCYDYAFVHGHEGTCKYLLLHLPPQITYDELPKIHGYVHHACSRGQYELVEMLLERGYKLDSVDVNGEDALCIAARSGNLRIVELLHRKGADPRRTYNNGSTALLSAIAARQSDVAAYLIDFSDLSASGVHGQTALLMAVSENMLDLTKQLLDGKVKLKNAKEFNNGFGALHVAAEIGSCRMIGLLASRGFLTDARDLNDFGPLDVAVHFGHPEAVDALLKLGADPSSANSSGASAVHRACRMGRLEELKLLIDHGDAQSLLESNIAAGYAPLHLAVTSEHVETTKYLLSIIGRPLITAANFGNLTPFFLALLSGNSELSRCLMRAGQLLKYRDRHGNTALHYAAYSGLTELIQELIDDGAPACSFNIVGDSALHAAADYGHEAFALQICEQYTTAELNTRNRRGCSVLHNCASMNLQRLCRYLTIEKEVTQQADENMWLPLHYAARNGHTAIIKLLVPFTNIDSKTKLSETPLLLAAKASQVDAMAVLIQLGAKVDLADQFGFTPLLTSIVLKDKRATRLLLDAGADCFLRTLKGDSALSLAAANADSKLFNDLLQLGQWAAQISPEGTDLLGHAVLSGDLDLFETVLRNHLESGIDQGTPLMHCAVRIESVDMMARVASYDPACWLRTDTYDQSFFEHGMAASGTNFVLMMIDKYPHRLINTIGDYTLVGLAAGLRLSVSLEKLLKVLPTSHVHELSGTGCMSPLQLALYAGSSRVVELLVTNGADPYSIDALGTTAFEAVDLYPTCGSPLSEHWTESKRVPRIIEKDIQLHTILRCLGTLVALPDDLPRGYQLDTVKSRARRNYIMSHLLWSLRRYHGEELPWEIWCIVEEQRKLNHERQEIFRCCICTRFLIRCSIYLCTTCGLTELCADCFRAIDQPGSDYLQKIRTLEDLEESVLPLAICMQQFDDRKRAALFYAARQHAPLMRTMDPTIARYETCEASWGDAPRLPMYGLELLRMIRDAAQFETRASVLAHWLGHSNDERSIRIDERYTMWRKTFRAERFRRFPCAGHKHVLLDDSQLNATGRPFLIWTRDGYLTKTCLRLWLKKYQLLRDGLVPDLIDVDDLSGDYPPKDSDSQYSFANRALNLADTDTSLRSELFRKHHELRPMASNDRLRERTSLRDKAGRCPTKQGHIIPDDDALREFIAGLDLDDATRSRLARVPRLVTDLTGLRFLPGKRRAIECRIHHWSRSSPDVDAAQSRGQLEWETTLPEHITVNAEPHKVVRIDGELPPIVTRKMRIQLQFGVDDHENELFAVYCMICDALEPGSFAAVLGGTPASKQEEP